MYGSWGPYLSVAEQRLKAMRKLESLRQKGRVVSPVVVDGRVIAKTFWGKAWCDHLEQYSDLANRLPRGRSYVRNGSVVDLQIAAGKILAMVSGSDLYTVEIEITPIDKARWLAICTDCAGSIDSLVELLQGRLAKSVMERMCCPKTGLFPSSAEVRLFCNCPDWADLCKHAAAVLYGVGARLDQQPELLFRLHGVEAKELIASATRKPALSNGASANARVLSSTADLSALFGLDIAPNIVQSLPRKASAKPPAPAPKKKPQDRNSKIKTPVSKRRSQENAPVRRAP